MPATITYASNRVTITGPYKQFTGTSTTTVVTFSAGEAPAAGDVGRFILWCRGGTTLTGPWEVRRIIAATSTTVTVHDAWGATPSAGDTFRISSTMDDILTAQPSAGTKVGAQSFYIDGDYSLADRAFLGSADQAVEWFAPSAGQSFPTANNTVTQVGVLWGGENKNSTETTNGSRWSLRVVAVNNTVFYSSSFLENSGHVFNFFGSLLESSTTSDWLFFRMNGPARFIGSVFDGAGGGRFMHPSSEWVQCRHSGITEFAPAWSLGATFTRPISDLVFYRNITAAKNFQAFGGNFRNCTFADSNTSVFRVDGTADSTVNFIDCTEFADDKISDNGAGTLNQFKSVNYTVQNTAGAAIQGAQVRVANAAGTTQGSIQTTNASGVAAEILALRRQWVNTSPSVTFAPFQTRIRRYGFLFLETASSVADPIRQVVQLSVDPYVVANEATASAYTGVTVNGTTKRVSFGAGTTDTFAKLYDHVQWWGQQSIAFEMPWSRVSNQLAITPGWTVVQPNYTAMVWVGGAIEWSTPGTILGAFDGCQFNFATAGEYNLTGATFSGTIEFNNTSGGGVQVIVVPSEINYINNNPGTLTVLVAATPATGSVTNIVSGSRLQVFNVTTNAEVFNGIVSGTSYTLNYTDGTTFSNGDLVRIRLAYQNGTTAKEFVEAEALASGTGWSYRANQVDDTVYIANGINGSAVTGITITDSIDRVIINIAGGSVSWPQIYAYNVFWLFTAAGIVDDGAIITAKDTANYTVAGFKIRNSSTVPLSITSGYGVDAATGSVASLIDVAGSVGNIYQTPDVVIAYATGSGLSPAESAQLFSLNTGAVNVESINGAEVIGNGSEANPWRGVGVSP